MVAPVGVGELHHEAAVDILDEIATLRGGGLHAVGKTTQRVVASDIEVRETAETQGSD
ncbi:hypothetical protein [Halocatena salina]|uniref:Uncharacterized protein n=1 Tax=Halocatena salina TaxID=2934340 RepID=A0A8U0A6X0_9EURY|nr:hypothetical protein [Halocatena salina]UPM44931.1 hypothetical protein MW046_15560 [Halocatena salina]